MIIVSGPGGVGKTTSAAALGILAAMSSPKRVLVLTVDPARRLASALGLVALGNAEVDVALDGARGSLTMAMIDTKASWDELVRRHAPDADTRDRVLHNELYKTLTARFVHSHDYVVTERLYDAHESGRFDLVIVDTPPSRSALSVLDAPRRMDQFFSSRLLKLLTAPSQSRLLTIASRPFFLVADRILGSVFLKDITEFFTLFRTMEAPIVARARRVGALLGDASTSYLVVTTPEPVALREAEYLANELRRREHRLAAVLANRLVPSSLAASAASRMHRIEREYGQAFGSLVDAEREIALVAERQRGALARAASWGAPVLVSETSVDELADRTALLRLAQAIMPNGFTE